MKGPTSPTASPSSSRPVYLRLRDLIAAAILDGDFAEGEMLPSVRAFAAEQGANPLTVAKAFQQFQDDGLIAVRRGVGMYVVDGAAERLRLPGYYKPAFSDAELRLIHDITGPVAARYGYR